ncbi:MAG: peptide chain release factor 1 [Nevskiaceae bacterium]|nr:MAG: peptide chain release factor 1 [Nevskiaceae bacterium]TBR73600.1 MAG: peptide chain release factor 1 [Nevskiaceae bacterium]
MKESLKNKLLQVVDRSKEVAAELAAFDASRDPDGFRRRSQEYAQVQPIAERYADWAEAERELLDLEALQAAEEPELREMARDEWHAAVGRRDALEARLREDLLPRDPLDAANVFLEIRAGTGGEEAALFAADLFRMYNHYGERHGWTVEVLSHTDAEQGGYREIISRVAGADVYALLRFESGVHRVQRVPVTEAQGRIHTSAATVAVLPEVAEVEAVALDPADLRIDTYRSSGAGGQHVNKTDSAIRITHLPTGLVVECQDERSQHRNKARAMSLLASRLLERERSQQQQATAAERRAMVGSGDRSERIRTYNFPQGRVTDHRINLTLYQLDRVMAGDLDLVIEPLRTEQRARQLAEHDGR